MNKQVLKNQMKSIENIEFLEADMYYEQFIEDNKIDNYDTIDLDDLSHSSASEDLAYELDDRIHENEEDIRLINQIDFGPKTDIQPGAVAKINDRYFFIGIAKPPFQFEGKKMIGISTKAPIYPSIAGKKAGDKVKYNNMDLDIQEIY